MDKGGVQIDERGAAKEVCYPGSNRIGKFHLLHEVLRDGANRPWLQALHGLTVILEVEDHDSGRGKTYVAASELFQPLAEGEEIPEYRIECNLARPFTAEEETKALASGQFRFYAVRNILLRVPAIALHTLPKQTQRIH